uniref:Fibronectin type-III domain-containing protein n=1 Tax=Dendroctonus ponderosae TaxID=77166 RepID=A0AAR5PZ60_DENPD
MKVFAPTLLVAIFLASSNAVCIPGQVSNVVLSSNYSLSWSEASNPHNCTISNYVVEVLDDEDSATIFQVQTVKNILHYNFNFLDMCKSYSFNVHALTSDFVLGPADSYSATTEPLDSANLTLAYVELDETEGSDDVMEVSWDLASDEASRCVTSYRVSYWDERNKPQEQFVSAKSFAFEEEAACRNYSLQVSAIIGNPDIEGPALTAVFPGHSKVPDVPTSANVSPTSNSATMIWKLEAYEKNLCTMLALNVRTLGAPNDETNLRILVTDNLLRPDVIVTLTRLSANTVYTSYVNAENIAGTSKDVTVMFQTTDE